MISRNHRFHGHKSLSFLFKRGKTQRSEFITLRYVSSKSEDYRLAIIVSKKVSKSAVVRNRIRRRLYEAVRTIHKDSNTKWPYDMSLAVYDESVASMPHDKLSLIVNQLLSKASII